MYQKEKSNSYYMPVIKKKKRVHIPKPEICKFCNKHFKDTGAMRKHIKYVHFEGDQYRPFVCKQCNKCFARKYCLQMHWKTHAQNREIYKCQQCESKFCSDANRRKH